MRQNDSHLNCLCVMARLIEALAISLLLLYFFNAPQITPSCLAHLNNIA